MAKSKKGKLTDDSFSSRKSMSQSKSSSQPSDCKEKKQKKSKKQKSKKLQSIQDTTSSEHINDIEFVQESSNSINSNIDNASSRRLFKNAFTSSYPVANFYVRKSTATKTNKNWNEKAELILQEWSKKAKGRSWMHKESANYYRRLKLFLGIPPIILGPIATSTLISTLVTPSTAVWFLVLVTCLSIIKDILSTLFLFANFESKQQKHEIASQEFKSLVRKIQTELILDWPNRMECRPFFEQISMHFNRLTEISESVPEKIENKYEQYQQTILDTSSKLEEINLPLGNGKKLCKQSMDYDDSIDIMKEVRKILNEQV